jgi:hypothetical protein
VQWVSKGTKVDGNPKAFSSVEGCAVVGLVEIAGPGRRDEKDMELTSRQMRIYK